MNRFKIGQQPCNNFIPQLEENEFGIWENRHQCYRCGGIVSFCVNCYRDHHDGGYENCIPDDKEINNEKTNK